MLKKIAVDDIMTRNVVKVSPSDDLHYCSKKMIKHRINSLPVVNGTRLIGILTARDILWASVKKANLKNIKAADIAVRKVAVVKPSLDIGFAFKKMKKYGFRRLPVISKGVLVGILTLKDVLRVDPELYKQIGEFSDIREEKEKLGRIKEFEDNYIRGICDECEDHEDLLKFEGRYLCQYCRDELY